MVPINWITVMTAMLLMLNILVMMIRAQQTARGYDVRSEVIETGSVFGNAFLTKQYPSEFTFLIQRNSKGGLDIVPIKKSRPSPSEKISKEGLLATTEKPQELPTPPTRGSNNNDKTESLESLGSPSCSDVNSNDNYCTSVDNYPTNLLKNIIQKEAVKLQFAFGNDPVPETSELSERIQPDEEALCYSRQRIIFPRAAKSINNEWRIVLNQENYTQGIRIEECSSPGSKCRMTDNFPFGYTTKCQQMYMERYLYAVNKQGSVIKDQFNLPSCCKCIVRYH